MNSVNGITGPVGITAGSNITLTQSGNTLTIASTTVTTTASNSGATAYPVFTFGAGNTALYVDSVSTPLSYIPSSGTVNARVLKASAGAISISVDAPSSAVTINDGADLATFGSYSFVHTGSTIFDISSNVGLAIGGPDISFYGAWGAYWFPSSVGSSGQALLTNATGNLYWGNVSSSGGSGFTYSASAPGSPSAGDRWIDSDTGKEYVYVYDGSSSQWIEPVSSNGLDGLTYTIASKLYEFGGTGSFVKLGVGTNAPTYTLHVVGDSNFTSGISAASVSLSAGLKGVTASFSGGINGVTASFSGAVSSDAGYQITSGAINSQTGTTYTLLSTDNGKIITWNNNTSGVTLTVPSGLPVGFNTTVIQVGTGSVGITGSSVTLNSFEGKLRIAGQHAAVSIISYSSNVFNVAGGLTA